MQAPPFGFVPRAPEGRDADEIATRINRYRSRFPPFQDALAPEDVLADYCNGDQDRGCRILVSDAGHIAALAFIRAIPPRYAVFRSRVYVFPEFQNLGLGAHIDAWLRATATLRARGKALSAHVTLQQRIIRQDERARSFLLNAGYRPFRQIEKMEIDLASRLTQSEDTDTADLSGFNWATDFEDYVRAARSVDSESPFYEPVPLEEDLKRYRQSIPTGSDFDPSLVIIARVSGQLVGYCVGQVSSGEEGGIGVIRGLGVTQPRRRHGIGTRLVATVMEGLRRRSIRHVILHVDTTNSAAASRLYASMGFQTTESESEYELGLDLGDGRRSEFGAR